MSLDHRRDACATSLKLVTRKALWEEKVCACVEPRPKSVYDLLVLFPSLFLPGLLRSKKNCRKQLCAKNSHTCLFCSCFALTIHCSHRCTVAFTLGFVLFSI